jgi:hypothetical protein
VISKKIFNFLTTIATNTKPYYFASDYSQIPQNSHSYYFIIKNLPFLFSIISTLLSLPISPYYTPFLTDSETTPKISLIPRTKYSSISST